jgi:predicted permease
MNSWALRLSSKVSGLFRQKKAESEFDTEMQLHLQLLTEKFIRQGMSLEDADSAARRQFGNTTLLGQRQREARTFLTFSTVFQDVRYGLRLLRKAPGFTAIAVASLALAIGANTTIFSLAKNLLFDRLHVAHAEQLRMLRWAEDNNSAVNAMWGDFEPDPRGAGMVGSVFSYPVYQQLRAHNAVLEDLLAFKEDSLNATVRGNAQRVDVDLVSGNFYAVLGTKPQLGRAIQPTDDASPGAGAVAVISEGVWEGEFGRSPAVLGQTITVNQIPLTIVGVNPRGFTGAKNTHDSPDLFVPLSMQPVVDPKGRKGSLLTDSDMWWLNVVGRARPRVADRQAEAALNVELAGATRATMTVKPGQTTPRLALADGGRGLNDAARIFRKPVYALMTMTGFVLLLACTHIANLLLARGAQREREMSLRLALGAGRRRVLRQMFTESLLLAGLGGAGGLLLGYLGRNLIQRLMASGWRSGFEVPMDWGAFAFAAGVTLLSGLIFGLAPAWLAARSELSGSLKRSAHTTTRRRKGVGGKAIVAFQIALSTLLVVGAGLFLRTLWALEGVDAGFRTDHLILFEISPPVHRYGSGKDVALHQRLEEAIAALPGVEGVSPGWTAYLSDNLSNGEFALEDEKPASDHDDSEDINVVGNTYFQTMGIPIAAGRGFGPQDTVNSAPVAVINQALANKRFPGTNPIGRRFKTDDDKPVWIEVVGVCGDNHYRNLRDEAPPQFFLPYVQQPQVGSMTYAVRTQLAPGTLLPALHHVVQQVDRDLPIVDIRTQREQIYENMQTERMFAALTTGFGVLALALACVGIYGVMAYSVANRRNEIGIRLALGARPGQVRGMILGESTWLAVAGIVVGVGAALGLTRLVKSMLYGIHPYDLPALSCGVSILLVVALAASWIPARRAARVETIEALRHE